MGWDCVARRLSARISSIAWLHSHATFICEVIVCGYAIGSRSGGIEGYIDAGKAASAQARTNVGACAFTDDWRFFGRPVCNPTFFVAKTRRAHLNAGSIASRQA